MGSTFLLHKPVIYGSAFANSLFLIVLLLHIIPAAVAPISAIVAFFARKGSKVHLRSGRIFAGLMASIALTGIVLDVVRLCFFVEENHTKYAGTACLRLIPLVWVSCLWGSVCFTCFERSCHHAHSVDNPGYS